MRIAKLVKLFSLVACVFVVSPASASPYSALVMEVESERPLYSRNADELRHPASLTKMMTLYMVFDALARKQINLQDHFRTSRYAASKSPSKLGLSPGDTITVEEGVLGLVTQSANDAATVLAEGLGGSEANFADMMTRKARELGMLNTVFQNASGLPDPNQVTTARDMFRLGKSLLKNFPQYYAYFSTESFSFRGRNFHNHNHLLDSYPGTDGIKTGFVNSSGFNLVASAKRGSYRLIGVVFGGPTHARRDAHMRTILDDGFAQLDGQEANVNILGFETENTPSTLPRPRSIKLSEDTIKPVRRLHLGHLNSKSNKPLVAQRNVRPSLEREQHIERWQVRLGEFDKGEAAEHRLAQALKAAPQSLKRAKVALTPRSVQKGKKTFVASFRGFNRMEAQEACRAIRGRGIDCSIVMASR